MTDSAVDEVIAAGKRLADQGLVCAHSGNISCRTDGETVLITASGVCKGGLTARDVLRIDYWGQAREAADGRRPSSETALHLALYQEYPQIAAIVHAHPPYATAMSCAGRELDWQMLEESALFLGPVPRLPRLSAGSRELALAAAAAARDVKALLLSGHGALSWGENMEQALTRLEILEHTARVMLLCGLFAAHAGTEDV